MYQKGNAHVEVLTASVRSLEHLFYALKLGSDIITAPFSVLKEWALIGLPIPVDVYVYQSRNLRAIPYRNIDLTKKWQDYDIYHELTDKGMEKFSQDWNTMI